MLSPRLWGTPSGLRPAFISSPLPLTLLSLPPPLFSSILCLHPSVTPPLSPIPLSSFRLRPPTPPLTLHRLPLLSVSYLLTLPSPPLLYPRSRSPSHSLPLFNIYPPPFSPSPSFPSLPTSPLPPPLLPLPFRLLFLFPPPPLLSPLRLSAIPSPLPFLFHPLLFLFFASFTLVTELFQGLILCTYSAFCRRPGGNSSITLDGGAPLPLPPDPLLNKLRLRKVVAWLVAKHGDAPLCCGLESTLFLRDVGPRSRGRGNLVDVAAVYSRSR